MFIVHKIYFLPTLITLMTGDTADVKAMHERDLKGFLTNLGILHKIERHEYDCVYCQNRITLERIGTISKSEGKIVICCDNPVCLQKFFDEQGGGG